MDNLTPAQRKKNMQRVRSTGSQPELLIRRELRRQKVYFAHNVRSLPGKPDLVFRKKRVAIFIDSDFWHCHPQRFTMPKSNARYWVQKIARNVARDETVNAQLKLMGWRVIRLWEHDVQRNPARAAQRILTAIK
jgi:DNA mismatch endonuclease (patch repair protein)